MADRSVSVRLRLINAEYRRGMAEATGDTTKFAAAAKGAFSGLGDQLKQVGGTMTRNVTVPIAALGAGALKLGNDFETAFAHMVGLANVPAAEIDGLKQSVLGLAHETARSPQELAEALYYIRSSGISAAKSLDVLKVAGQAAAAGLGSTQDIAKAVGFAINAYGENNLTAARATDILVGTIREGTIEAGELAPVMGTLIPTASALGISFETVAGTMAVMSKNGADASDSATGLSAVMSTLLGTSAAGTQLLEEHGLSLKGLRDIAAGPGGLVAVFRTLDATFKGNDEALATVIPNIRALRSFMNVLSQDAAGVDKTLQAVSNSAGDTASAFDAVANTDAFKQKQALTDAKVALVQLGEAIAPLVAALATAGAAFAGAFGGLPPVLEKIALGFAVVLAAVGPVASIGGRIVQNFKLIADGAKKAFELVQKGALNAVGSLGAIGVAAGVAGLLIAGQVVAWQRAERAAAASRERVDEYARAIRDAGSATGGAAKSVEAMFQDTKNDGLLRQLIAAGVSVGDFSAAVAQGGKAFDDMRTKIIAALAETKLSGGVRRELDALGVSVTDIIADLGKGGDGLRAFGTNTPSAAVQNFVAALAALNGQVAPVGSEFARAAAHADLLAQATGGGADSFLILQEAVTGAVPAVAALGAGLDNVGDDAIMASSHLKGFLDFLGEIYGASFDVLDSQNAWRNSLDDVASAATTTGGAARDLTSEQRSLEKATKDVTKAQQGLIDAEAALAEARKGPTDREKHDAGLGVREANLGLKDAQQALADAQKKVTEEQKKGKDGDVKSARLALEHASLNLVKAQDAVTDAQAAQNDVLTSGEETSKKVKTAVDDVTAAQERLADAQQSEADAEKALSGTNGGPVADKHRAIKSAIDQSVTAGDNWIKKLIEQKAPAGDIIAATDDQREAVQKLIDTYGDPDGKLKKYLNYLLLIATLEGKPLPSWADPVGIALAAADALPSTRGASAPIPHASGGPTVAGQTYMVGERGPELWTSGGSGYVTPNSHLTAASSYGSTGSTMTTERTVVATLEGEPVLKFIVRASYDGRLRTEIR